MQKAKLFLIIGLSVLFAQLQAQQKKAVPDRYAQI